MSKLTSPSTDGYFMPGEFEPHSGCLMIWPKRPGSWKSNPSAAQKAFCEVARAISESETLYMLAFPEDVPDAKAKLYADTNPNIHVIPMETDDSWARDVGPTFLINKQCGLRGVDWQFNAWGGEFDGLYAQWDRDDKVASSFCDKLGVPCYDAHPFVLEGGSIHSDGEGTVLVTESCLLSQGRNPQMSKDEISAKLCEYLGAKKVIWLPYGIYNDETNEHVDNVCAFTKPGEVVLAWTDNMDDPQYEMSKADLEILMSETDAKGRKINIVKLPVPSRPICLQEKDLDGFSFEEGEDTREVGERLAASYINFYIANKAVVVPQFGDESNPSDKDICKSDKEALKILAKCFPDREIKPIAAINILLGGGNIHCITQQIPMCICDMGGKE